MPFSSLLNGYIYVGPFERSICQKGKRWWSCTTMMKQFPLVLELLCLLKVTFFPKTPLQKGWWTVGQVWWLLWLLGSMTAGTLENRQQPPGGSVGAWGAAGRCLCASAMAPCAVHMGLGVCSEGTWLGTCHAQRVQQRCSCVSIDGAHLSLLLKTFFSLFNEWSLQWEHYDSSGSVL